MLIMMMILFLYGWLMQAYGISGVYHINLHEGLIIMLVLDDGLDHVVLFGLFDYFMRIEGLIW